MNLTVLNKTPIIYLTPDYLFWRIDTTGLLESLPTEMSDLKG